eukprot:2655155-Alexandrium_andersonii.AAC.1
MALPSGEPRSAEDASVQLSSYFRILFRSDEAGRRSECLPLRGDVWEAETERAAMEEKWYAQQRCGGVHRVGEALESAR